MIQNGFLGIGSEWLCLLSGGEGWWVAVGVGWWVWSGGKGSISLPPLQRMGSWVWVIHHSGSAAAEPLNGN